MTSLTRAPECSIHACVVTHNPGCDFKENLSALRAQGSVVVVVDNASSEQAAVARLARELGCEFIANETNRGVAAALNQGVVAARASGAEWLALFDQDSRVPDCALLDLMRIGREHPDFAQVGILAMTHSDRVTGRHYHLSADIIDEAPAWRLLRRAITSGSVVRMATLAHVGTFDEGLFIDSVDHEFCLRARAGGWIIIESCAHVLEHSIGAATFHSFLGRRVVCTNHAPARRYFMARNQLEVARRFALREPRYAVTMVLHIAKLVMGVLLYEDQKRAKLMAFARGVGDFVRRRFGPMPGSGRR